jgi:hypothetical protein
MMNRPGRAPRFFNARVAVVAGLSLIIFFGCLSIFSAAAAGKLVYVANGPVNAGQRLEASLFTSKEVKGDFDGAFVLGEKEFDAMVGSVVIGNLIAGDILRDSDVFVVKEPGLSAADLTNGSRLTALLAAKELRAVVLLDDQSSTYAKAGDLLDIYGVLGSGDDAIISFCFSKPAIYVLPRTIPNLPDADKWLPGGTAYVLGGVSAEEAGQLIAIQERGTVRIALARPDADPLGGSCSTRFSAEGYAIDGVITNPDGTDATPTPTPSPDATVAP